VVDFTFLSILPAVLSDRGITVQELSTLRRCNIVEVFKDNIAQTIYQTTAPLSFPFELSTVLHLAVPSLAEMAPESPLQFPLDLYPPLLQSAMPAAEVDITP
jgi:hypothetical protein